MMGLRRVIDRSEAPYSSAPSRPSPWHVVLSILNPRPPTTDQERWRRLPPSETLGGAAKRMPGRSVGEPMNSMPAASSADFTSWRVEERLGGIPFAASKRLIVRAPTPEWSDNCSIDHLSTDRHNRGISRRRLSRQRAGNSLRCFGHRHEQSEWAVRNRRETKVANRSPAPYVLTMSVHSRRLQGS